MPPLFAVKSFVIINQTKVNGVETVSFTHKMMSDVKGHNGAKLFTNNFSYFNNLTRKKDLNKISQKITFLESFEKSQ